MPKSKRHYRKSRKLRKSRKDRSLRNYSSLGFKRDLNTVKARGLSPKDNLPCSMCDRQFPRESMFIPLSCLKKNQDRAHRICEDCWWDPKMGFAREDAPHDCPGCKRHLPLNPPIKSKPEEIIVISDSTD